MHLLPVFVKIQKVKYTPFNLLYFNKVARMERKYPVKRAICYLLLSHIVMSERFWMQFGIDNL